MSKATVISIVPFVISEFKPGIYPGQFQINPSKDGIPEVLSIGESVFFIELDEKRTMTVSCSAEKLAKSIVEDYMISNIGYSYEEAAYPGLFWKEGSFTQKEVISKFGADLEKFKENQLRWFKKLVEMADDDWEKTRQHKCISDAQRHAAKALGMERPWIINLKLNEIKVPDLKCIACQSVVSSIAIVCPNCRCILNMAEYKKLQFVEVGK